MAESKAKIFHMKDYRPATARHTGCLSCKHQWVEVYGLMEQFTNCPSCGCLSIIGNGVIRDKTK